VVQVLRVQRFGAPADVVRNLDVAHGRERRQQVELLKDEADAVLAQRVRSASLSVAKSTPSMTTRPVVAWVRPPSR
jgi:hypothetical protein